MPTSTAPRAALRHAARSVALLAALSAALVACGGSDEDVAATSMRSNERPAAGDAGSGSGGGSSTDDGFCDRLAGIDDLDLDTDPEGATDALAELQASAPDELTAAFATMGDVAQELAGLDQSDPDSFARALEIATDEKARDAAQLIDGWASEHCGLDLDGGDGVDATDPSTADPSTADPSTTDTTDPFTTDTTEDRSSPTDIDLEDIDAVEEAHDGEVWTQRITSTSIVDDTTVTLAAASPDLIAVEDAMAACEAVLSALVRINPQVTLDVRNDDVVIVAAPAGGTCAPA